TKEERAERGSYVGCIAGALSRTEYIDGLEAAGFENVSVEFTHEVADGMNAAIIKAVKGRGIGGLVCRAGGRHTRSVDVAVLHPHAFTEFGHLTAVAIGLGCRPLAGAPGPGTVGSVAEDHVVDVAGREMSISSPSKVFFSERGETKLDLVRYYLAISQPLMRAVGGRPALMQRFPHGADGSSFFQKRVPDTAPDWLQTTVVTTPNGTTSRALVLADAAHVVWGVNLACLGFHVWPYVSRRPEVADELRLDLDPQPGVDFDGVRAAAFEVRQLLDELGIVGYPK